MATEVEILGHKAKIERVTGQVKLEPWWSEDQLEIWLSFDEAVDSTLSFATYLPAKRYADREEFLEEVRRRGEEDLKRILAKDEEKRKEREERQQRQKALDAVAAEAQSLLE
ncbi:hypothetical protein ES703_121912 [subsurface metagenome]